jgi:hypothetical protein
MLTEAGVLAFVAHGVAAVVVLGWNMMSR